MFEKITYLHTRSLALTLVLVIGGGGVATGNAFLAGGGAFLVIGGFLILGVLLFATRVLLVVICGLVGVAVFDKGGGGMILAGVDLVCRPLLVVMGGVFTTGGADAFG